MRFGKLLILVMISAVAVFTVYAESFDDYLKSQNDDFQQFKDERDKEFTAFLKEMWIKIETEKPVDLVDRPKPLKIPAAPIPNEPTPEPAPSYNPAPVILPVPSVPAQPVFKPRLETKGKELDFSFFGNSIVLGYDPKLSNIRIEAPFSGEKMGVFWEKCALTDYEPILNNLLEYKKGLKMTDWGFILLVNEAAGRIAADKNSKLLIGWFLLSKAGYETRTAYDNTNLYLLVPAYEKLYSVSYFTLGGKNFYAISPDGFINKLSGVYTYQKSYPNAEKAMEFRMKDYPDLGRKISERELNFTYGGVSYKITVPYNMNDIIYLKNHPQTDVALYAEAGLPENTAKALLSQLKPIIAGKSNEEAINILLKFVQTAFAYATDEQQFGREKFMFAIETIYYPYSDCEDRSIIFAYLVRELLDLPVVFLHYPNHIATAVDFKKPVKGDFITYSGKRYTVTDPTYINATYGMTMPQYAKTVPEIMPF